MALSNKTKHEFFNFCKDIIYFKLFNNIEIEIGYDIDFKPLFYFTEDSKKKFPNFCSKQIEINKWILDHNPQLLQHLESLESLRAAVLIGFDDEDSLSGLLELEQALLEVFKIQLILGITQESNVELIENSTGINHKINVTSEGMDFFSAKEREFLFSNKFNPLIQNLIFEIEAKRLFIQTTKKHNSYMSKNLNKTKPLYIFNTNISSF